MDLRLGCYQALKVNKLWLQFQSKGIIERKLISKRLMFPLVYLSLAKHRQRVYVLYIPNGLSAWCVIIAMAACVRVRCFSIEIYRPARKIIKRQNFKTFQRNARTFTEK